MQNQEEDETGITVNYDGETYIIPDSIDPIKLTVHYEYHFPNSDWHEFSTNGLSAEEIERLVIRHGIFTTIKHPVIIDDDEIIYAFEEIECANGIHIKGKSDENAT